MEDASNRNRLAKLLRFYSSNDAKTQTTLASYIERMKDKQDAIYYIAGSSRKEVEASPFVERLLKKGYEVLYLTVPVDEYCVQSMPEFDGKKFQNVAKDGLNLDEGDKAKEAFEVDQKNFELLLTWLKDKAHNNQVGIIVFIVLLFIYFNLLCRLKRLLFHNVLLIHHQLLLHLHMAGLVIWSAS